MKEEREDGFEVLSGPRTTVVVEPHNAEWEVIAADTISKLKESLANRYPEDRETYTASKSKLISEIIAKACCWRKGQNA